MMAMDKGGTGVKPSERIFVAIDTTDLGSAVELANGLAGHVGGIKLGWEFFTAHGPEGVKQVTAAGTPLFLDLKFHDIPNTIAGAMRAALPMKPKFINVHASGGMAMMRAAYDAASEAGDERPLLLAVTVLTSLSDDDLAKAGVFGTVTEQVVRLGVMAQDSGMDGVVCSAKEIMALRGACGPDFKLVVPGIRPEGTDVQDQKRVVTPREAVALGADHLVIGRPITQAADPVAAAKAIAEGLS